MCRPRSIWARPAPQLLQRPPHTRSVCDGDLIKVLLVFDGEAGRRVMADHTGSEVRNLSTIAIAAKGDAFLTETPVIGTGSEDLWVSWYNNGSATGGRLWVTLRFMAIR